MWKMSSIWYGLRTREIISIIDQWLIDDWKFAAYWLFIDYPLKIGYNQWLINWLLIDYLLTTHRFHWCHRLVTSAIWQINIFKLTMGPGVPGGGGVHRISSDGNDRMGGKTKTSQKSLGPPSTPQKSLDRKLTRIGESPSLKNFQKALSHYLI